MSVMIIDINSVQIIKRFINYDSLEEVSENEVLTERLQAYLARALGPS